MTFKKKAPKPPKATINDLLQSGALKTGPQVVKDAEAKAKTQAEFDQAVQDELLDMKSKGRG